MRAILIKHELWYMGCKTISYSMVCNLHCTGCLKKTGPCLLAIYLWQYITVWTGNTLIVCCKLSLSSDMLVKAYSKPQVYYQSIWL